MREFPSLASKLSLVGAFCHSCGKIEQKSEKFLPILTSLSFLRESCPIFPRKAHLNDKAKTQEAILFRARED
ncbi:MAG TPA: hypothetical protein DD458_05470 [Prolixibacteraceae bacterium]|nr:MAG: hypothetical protein A2W92_09095 [Bacteroidetes bacterium GWA2_42_15]OFX97926.1 MAG: hypothetical protein A2W89_07670 [Bacteroidetes bacterium GWE2_42_39]HBL74662.1 hypothetical protein [Prolixibacteraceae bacterium]HCR89347.1 hypothetical protein [Prolixibacteraceae bacterium]HCU60831.1 hypothetical protein [Prolixibacteraceae bacterium]